MTIHLLLALFFPLIITGSVSPQSKFVMQNTSSFIDDDKIIHLYGELKNNTNRTQTNIVVNATFYDSHGKLLNEFERAIELRTLNPGGISPFEILYTDPKTSDSVSRFELSAAGTGVELKSRELSVSSDNSRLDLYGFYYINGKVVNKGSYTASNSMVVATLYDKDGKVVAIGRAQTEPVNITSQSEAAFGIAVTDKAQTHKVKRFTLIADSDEYLTVPEFSVLSLSLLFFIVLLAAVFSSIRWYAKKNISL
jgi:hypothetical protein